VTQIIATLRRLLPALPGAAGRFLLRYSLLAAALAIVDVVALMLLALTLASAITEGALTLPLIGALPMAETMWLILVLSVLVIGKSAVNVWMQWSATRHFASLEREIGGRLFSAYIRAPWSSRLTRNSAQIIQLADTGIANVIGGFLLPLTSLPGMIVTSLGVFVVIVVAQPLTAVVAATYLGGIAALQYFVLGTRARKAARVARDSALRVAALLSGMFATQKEIILRDKADEVEGVVAGQRALTARARANVNFLNAVPRFIYDAAVIGGFAIVGGAAFVTGGMDAAVSAVALFGIAGFRLVPSLTAFQNVMTRATTAIPYVERVIADIEDARRFRAEHEDLGRQPLPADARHLSFDGVAFSYPGSDERALREVTFDVPLGASVGIAGRSGAGKSTIVDLLLGLLNPTEGSITVGDATLADVLADWRHHIGYVPQDVVLFDGTIAQNIALTWGDDIDHERVERAARRAQLWDLVEQRAEGLQARIGERGAALSGGQRQRLGIARALYTDPLVLVLDEATSALDTKTESEVARAIRALHGQVTVIAVAHRLSTIRDADLILFMQDGRIAAQGRFDQVVAENDEFATQARLAGLIGGDS